MNPISETERIMRQIGKRITRPIRRDEAQPGMIFMSSHGYRLLITKVRDNAVSRVEDRGVEIIGRLHVTGPERNEIYPANSIIYIETTLDAADGIASMDAVLADEQAFDHERIRQHYGAALKDLTRVKLDVLATSDMDFDTALGEGRR